MHLTPPATTKSAQFIGILAAIALPAYQDYISKSQFTRVVGELAAGKTAIDAALFEGKTPVLDKASDSSNENIGLTTADTSTKPRSNLLAETGGIDLAEAGGVYTLTGTLGRNANKDIKTAQVLQIRDANGNWKCEVKSGSAQGFKDKFVPTGCVKS